MTRTNHAVLNLEDHVTRVTGATMDSLAIQESEFGLFPFSGSDLEGEIFRPIQYLGSKIRVIEEIMRATSALAKPGVRVADLFSGSSVVSQAFALSGYQVTATDTQKYAVSIAKACLGIGFEKSRASRLIESFANYQYGRFSVDTYWQEAATLERAGLKNRDAETIRRLYGDLDLIWRKPHFENFKRVSECGGGSGFGNAALITTIYSGSYFGVHQALEIDEIRHAIEELYISQEIDDWGKSAALTALYHASSRVVHSAGKHFAQPMNAFQKGAAEFNNRRLLEDRSISVMDCFMSALARIVTHAARMPEGHTAFVAEAESLLDSDLSGLRVAYLDPPYTAQQYSRFYHLLETLETYDFPTLLDGGKVTQGLYPKDRYKSAFSSKSKAGGSMQQLLSKLSANRVCALISYSRSSNGSNGNDRMITFDALTAMCRATYGENKVNLLELGHSYRQFNSAARANTKRDDPELLIVCNTD